jgi:hypothetical protein
MNSAPPRWTSDELSAEAAASAQLFRAERLADADAWSSHVEAALRKFRSLFQKLDILVPKAIGDEALAQAYGARLGEAIRYLAGPPISDDDLRVIADVESLAPGALVKDKRALRKVFEVVERVIDPYRFPWVRRGAAPTPEQLAAALTASAVLLAAQRIATERRNEGKDAQASQFCAECLLGERKADVVLRLHDTRLMAIECKVSNSATNSVKRLNNDAAAKAEYWLKVFGTSQVVPAAMLAGVFKVRNLEQAQQRGLALFWSHDLVRLSAFVESTR